MKTIVIKEEQKIVIPKVKLEINYQEDSVKLAINNNTDLIINGDFVIGCNGELSLISNENIHIDSRKNLYLNSKCNNHFERKKLKDSHQINERKKLISEKSSLIEEIERMKQRIADLEIKMSML